MCIRDRVSRLPDPKKSRIVYVKADYYESGLPSEEETTFTFLPVRLGNGNLGNVIDEFQDPRSDVNGWLIYDSNRFVYSELAGVIWSAPERTYLVPSTSSSRLACAAAKTPNSSANSEYTNLLLS